MNTSDIDDTPIRARRRRKATVYDATHRPSADGAFLPKDKVAAACRTLLETYERELARIREPIIAQEMQPQRGFFAVRPARTREEVVRELEQYSIRHPMHPYNVPKLDWSRSRTIAKELLRIIAVCEDDVVFVSAESFSRLARYYPKADA